MLDIRETKALSTFKDRLFNYFFNNFIANFDTSRIQTWKPVCPHCHSIRHIRILGIGLELALKRVFVYVCFSIGIYLWGLISLGLRVRTLVPHLVPFF